MALYMVFQLLNDATSIAPRYNDDDDDDNDDDDDHDDSNNNNKKNMV